MGPSPPSKQAPSASLLPRSRQASFSGLNSLSLGPGGEAGSSLCAAGVQGWARVAGGGGTSEAGSRSTSRPMSQVQLAPLGPMDFSQGAARARPQTVPAHSPWWVVEPWLCRRDRDRFGMLRLRRWLWASPVRHLRAQGQQILFHFFVS